MNRNDLIEVMARELFETEMVEYRWADLNEQGRQQYLMAAGLMVDGITAFVAAWLESVPARYDPEPRSWELARRWREEMSL